jgi:hypothetical protein
MGENTFHGDGWGTVFLPGRDLAYTVRFDTGPGGPWVTELHVKALEGRPLTTADMRSIPLCRLAKTVAQMDPDLRRALKELFPRGLS